MSFTNQEAGWIGAAAAKSDTDAGMELLRKHFAGYRLAEACQAADVLRARAATAAGRTLESYVSETFTVAEMDAIVAVARDTAAGPPGARLASSFSGERLAAAVRVVERLRAHQPVHFGDGTSLERDAPEEPAGSIVADRTAYRTNG